MNKRIVIDSYLRVLRANGQTRVLSFHAVRVHFGSENWTRTIPRYTVKVAIARVGGRGTTESV